MTQIAGFLPLIACQAALPTTTGHIIHACREPRSHKIQTRVCDGAQFEDLVNTGEKTTIWCALCHSHSLCAAYGVQKYSWFDYYLQFELHNASPALVRPTRFRPTSCMMAYCRALSTLVSVLTQCGTALQGFVSTWEVWGTNCADRGHKDVMTTAAAAACLRIAIVCKPSGSGFFVVLFLLSKFAG